LAHLVQLYFKSGLLTLRDSGDFTTLAHIPVVTHYQKLERRHGGVEVLGDFFIPQVSLAEPCLISTMGFI
jgi:hypothetical protein